MPAHTPCPCSAPKNGLFVKCAAEFVGTFILVQTIILSVNSNPGFAMFPIGFVLAAMVYQMGHISGAQFNPAVSLGVWIAGGQPLATTICYWMSQFTAAVLSGFIGAHSAMVNPGPNYPEMLMFPSIDVENGDRIGIWTEFLFTFLLVSTVLNVAVTNSPAYKDNSFFGIAIGFALMAGIGAGGAFSGGAFNPAVVCGVNTGHFLFAKLQSNVAMGTGPLGNVGSPEAASWVIVMAINFLGGAVAGAWFLVTDKDKHKAPEVEHFAGSLAKPLNGGMKSTDF